MHKKDVLTAIQILLNAMGKPYYKSSDFNVYDAGELLSGKRNSIVRSQQWTSNRVIVLDKASAATKA
jgi:hypothetical protein